jgi:hypothetical protein
MNKHKIFAAVLGATIVFTACRKNDLQKEAVQNQASSGMKTVSSWSSEKMDKYTEFSSTVEDKNITSDIVSKGLVLAFKKSSNSVVSLPASEKSGLSAYSWYYQVAEGSIVFSADAYGLAKEPASNQSFDYFVVSEEKIKDLESKGYSKDQLMNLSYSDAASLLR